MNVWSQVKAAPGTARGGEGPKGEGAQAGVVTAINPTAGEVAVKWDKDGVIEAVAADQLIELS